MVDRKWQVIGCVGELESNSVWALESVDNYRKGLSSGIIGVQ